MTVGNVNFRKGSCGVGLVLGDRSLLLFPVLTFFIVSL